MYNAFFFFYAQIIYCTIQILWRMSCKLSNRVGFNDRKITSDLRNLNFKLQASVRDGVLWNIYNKSMSHCYIQVYKRWLNFYFFTDTQYKLALITPIRNISSHFLQELERRWTHFLHNFFHFWEFSENLLKIVSLKLSDSSLTWYITASGFL